MPRRKLSSIPLCLRLTKLPKSLLKRKDLRMEDLK